MSDTELFKAQVRMTAMHAAITLYCCHRQAGDANDGNEGMRPELIEELLPQLMRLRDMLLATALVEGPI